MVKSLLATSKNSSRLAALVSSVFWGAGALFALSIALMVSGAVILCMMCLLRLADLSEKWDGDALGQLFVLRGRIAQSMNREFRADPNADLARLSGLFLDGSNLDNGGFSDWSISPGSHPTGGSPYRFRSDRLWRAWASRRTATAIPE